MPRFNILALSGGGYMGLYTAQVLADLEARCGRPLAECFDLIVGTSVGGILGLGLATGVPARLLANAFDAEGEKIFSARPAAQTSAERLIDLCRYIGRSKYDGRDLEATIEGFISRDLMMHEIDKRVAVAAVNLSIGMPHTFRTPYAEGHSNSSGIRVLDVAMATSAAPVLLPFRRIGKEYYSDGGTYANAPDVLALHEAEALCGIPIEDIHMTSIGTTSAGYRFPEPKRTTWGVKDWSNDQRIVKMMLATQQNYVMRTVRARLGERYTRLDEVQLDEDAQHLGLDVSDPNARMVLKGLAQNTAKSLHTHRDLTATLDHTAAQVDTWWPFNGIAPTLY